MIRSEVVRAKLRGERGKVLIIILLVYWLGVFYLTLPEPIIPNLPQSLKSTEPGDTWQIPGVWAYYTNLSRRQVVNFYQKAFSYSPFLGIPLPTITLNHPPEYARETIRDTLQSNFYEELVHPLRESLFISGWIPGEDKVYLARSEKPLVDFWIDGQRWTAKITLYHVSSSFWARLMVWTGIVVTSTLLIYLLKIIITSPWRKRR